MINPHTLPKIAEGKTKVIHRHPAYRTMGVIRSKDDITAGDGKRHHVLPGKAKLANQTTVSVFKLLAKHGIPLAFLSSNDEMSFHANLCEMIPDEVVIRGEAAGSYLKRNPMVADGTKFAKPVVEHFLKTTGRTYKGHHLVCDDPYIRFLSNDEGINLHVPNGPVHSRGFLTLDAGKVPTIIKYRMEMEIIALDVFATLSDQWKNDNGRLIDLKIEFGILPNGRLVVADVIDCDSWRVIRHGIQLSKQGYRDGDDPEQVLKVYRIAAEICAKWS